MASIVIGSVMSSTMLWNTVNILVGILAIINMYAIFVLKDIIIDEYKYYKNTKKYAKINTWNKNTY